MNRKEHLQLMIYDDTDLTTNLRRLSMGKDLPEDCDLVDFNLPVGLTHSWFAGGRLYRRFGAIDTFEGFKVWHKALEWAATVYPEQKIDHIQYWGHGSPGKVWLNKETLTVDSFDGPYKDLLAEIRDRLTDDAIIWFRTCATLGADRGRLFARRAADFFGCRIVAHTHNINFFHGGLHSLRPGQDPTWPREEGIDEGTPEAPKKMKSSGWWWSQPNTITCLNNEFPEAW